MVELRDHRKAGAKRKWHNVVLFEREPRDWPGTSNECIELARFTHPGDAYIYASNLVKVIREDRLNLYHSAWAVVIR